MIIGLVTGFIFDLIIADRPDNPLTNLILLSYLTVAGSLIIILNLRTVRREETHPGYQPLFLIFILQFCFGALASNMLVLYGRSGTFAGSTLFFIILIGMLIGNEFLKTRYSQLRFNIVVYYMLLLTYLVIAAPTFIFHSVGTWVFLATGVMSLVIIAMFLAVVYWLVLRGRERAHQLYEVSFLVGFVFVLFTSLYFLRIIPPVPLSMKDIGVYHSLTPLATPINGNIYRAIYEEPSWFVFWRDTSSTYTVTEASPAFCYSSVFAPTGLSAPIFHRWEKYDDADGEWKQVFRTSFEISGGRERGFRGFTNSVVGVGKWRCNVETSNGALIGRVTFTVKQSSTPAEVSVKDL